ncbi:dihydrofolate reductase family protein [Nocardioides litoris]|uniref:dihydrofolate reductase family protein n=1 Tax=Nocardioides litoris TaxID=1926648 RepID=UPI001120189E|nr:dihydrofolate reductase family protein [Nocardioides litoris]
MSRYRYVTATSLDGFIADEHDSLAWLFAQEGGDDPQAATDGGPGDHAAFLARCGALVMGATTYAWLGDHLRESGEHWPYELPCFVFTHRTFEPLGDGIRFVAGRPGEHRSAIEAAAGGRDVWLVGGGGLVADFADAGMLDEAIVSIAPVTLGAGRPLLPRRLDLRLRDLGRQGPFAVATYDVVGNPTAW